MEYAFHVFNRFAADGMSIALQALLSSCIERKLTAKQKAWKNKQTDEAGTQSIAKPAVSDAEKAMQENALFYQPPVVVCIGSDLAIGDSVGPVSGSMLKYKTQGVKSFIYGTLSSPVTAKEIKYVRAFLKETHPFSPVIAVDAAVGAQGDIGLIKLADSPLFPGAGANKKLGAVGDISILAIVAEKSVANYGLFNTTRLNLVYSMSEIISEALSSILYNNKKIVDKQEESML